MQLVAATLVVGANDFLIYDVAAAAAAAPFTADHNARIGSKFSGSAVTWRYPRKISGSAVTWT